MPAPLFGLPIAIKDLALTKGLRTTFGSPIFADFVPQEDDFFVERIRNAGAIIIGKTNVPEFGLGSNTYNTLFGPTLNAFDPALTAGGSSGGAAVALALDMVPVADGSDFGGSLRNPAAYNNVYGFRPSQGLVPGGPDVDVFHAQMGVEGPMGRNVRDMALLLDVQAGYHPRAPLSHDKPGSFLEGLQTAADGGRIAWLGDLGGHLPVEAGILDLCEAALGRFASASFVTEPLVPDVDFEALWQAFVTLRQATSGCALKVHYDDPAKRRMLKPEAVWEVERTHPPDGAADLRRLRHPHVVASNAAVAVRTLRPHRAADRAGLSLRCRHPLAATRSPAGPWTATTAGCRFPPSPRSAAVRRSTCRSASTTGAGHGHATDRPPRGDLAVLRAAAAYEATLPWQAGAS